ncbi:MAG TPA: 16S rRNA (cytidine(1402)-2'-O)-methyltransferase [Candidatus Krumholzibacteria bacterium]|nr:16S rRNA (cytidine(1402)-2'-O)-methyltransferase [Candidatus Krumholzibacteria bacterium]HPD72131.1 16S rRNA (cytidine(1402)-2'-O)-methyltransferase [Candidatus Krumholzibacteria bacterium]HRY40937.1 16S rRNA (cytidine(1402)-2'-O)-methyltransferase [Candidatus Krumholzibacteria bacterium]
MSERVVTVPDVDLPAGSCWLVATPIGNLGDITLRALAILAACDVVYAEDTRQTRRLLTHFGLAKPLEAYHDHNKARTVPRIIERLRAGQRVAVVSDAGTPCVSDPGFVLVRALREAGLPWSVAPGASSPLAALVLAGFEPDRFVFAGYPPRKPGARTRWLGELLELECTVILLESVHRIRSTLEALAELAPARELAVCREITKVHEETLRGSAAALLDRLTGQRLRGELVLLLRGRREVPPEPGD